MTRSLVLLPLTLAAAACSHAQTVAEAPPAPPPLPPPVVATVPAPAHPPQPRSCSADDQCSSRELCIRAACTAITPALEECGVNRVHFDFDSDTIHQDDLGLLRRAARCLGADQRVHVVVEGNADERGTVEYNLHLGDRRATAVAKYLEGLGVPAAQLSTVSYGKELPLCTDHDEACWAENRRTAVVPNGEPKDISRIERLDERAQKARARRTAKASAPSGERPASGGSAKP